MPCDRPWRRRGYRRSIADTSHHAIDSCSLPRFLSQPSQSLPPDSIRAAIEQVKALRPYRAFSAPIRSTAASGLRDPGSESASASGRSASSANHRCRHRSRAPGLRAHRRAPLPARARKNWSGRRQSFAALPARPCARPSLGRTRRNQRRQDAVEEAERQLGNGKHGDQCDQCHHPSRGAVIAGVHQEARLEQSHREGQRSEVSNRRMLENEPRDPLAGGRRVSDFALDFEPASRYQVIADVMRAIRVGPLPSRTIGTRDARSRTSSSSCQSGARALTDSFIDRVWTIHAA